MKVLDSTPPESLKKKYNTIMVAEGSIILRLIKMNDLLGNVFHRDMPSSVYCEEKNQPNKQKPKDFGVLCISPGLFANSDTI